MTTGVARRPRKSYGTHSQARQRRKQKTRDLLLESATALFSSRGYSATSIDDVAAEAGVGRATFYLHFAGKAELIQELERSLAQRLLSIYGELGSMDRPTREDVRGWLERFIGFCQGEGKLVRLLYQIAGLEPAMLRTGMDIYQGFLEEVGKGDPNFAAAARGDDPVQRADAFLILFELEALLRYAMFANGALELQPLISAAAQRIRAFMIGDSSSPGC